METQSDDASQLRLVNQNGGNCGKYESKAVLNPFLFNWAYKTRNCLKGIDIYFENSNGMYSNGPFRKQSQVLLAPLVILETKDNMY